MKAQALYLKSLSFIAEKLCACFLLALCQARLCFVISLLQDAETVRGLVKVFVITFLRQIQAYLLREHKGIVTLVLFIMFLFVKMCRLKLNKVWFLACSFFVCCVSKFVWEVTFCNTG